MEILSHTMSGILLSQIIAPRPSNKAPIMLACVTATVLPDIDAVTYLFSVDLFGQIHQLYTHSLLALILIPPVAAGVAKKLFSQKSYLLFYQIFVIGMSVHIAEDLIALWPVQFFYPFSHQGWAFHLIRRDFSLVVVLIFLMGTALSFYDPFKRHSRWIAIGTFATVTLYLLIGPGY